MDKFGLIIFQSTIKIPGLSKTADCLPGSSYKNEGIHISFQRGQAGDDGDDDNEFTTNNNNDNNKKKKNSNGDNFISDSSSDSQVHYC